MGKKDEKKPSKKRRRIMVTTCVAVRVLDNINAGMHRTLTLAGHAECVDVTRGVAVIIGDRVNPMLVDTYLHGPKCAMFAIDLTDLEKMMRSVEKGELEMPPRVPIVHRRHDLPCEDGDYLIDYDLIMSLPEPPIYACNDVSLEVQLADTATWLLDAPAN